MNCFPDFSEHLYDYYYEYCVNYLTLFHYGWCVKIYLVLLFGTYAIVSSFLLPLCVGFCTLNKIATFLSLDKLASLRR